MEEREKIIYTTGKKWIAKMRNWKDETGLILTNKRLIIQFTGESIYLHEIKNIDITTGLINIPTISFIYDEDIETDLRFYKNTVDRDIHLWIGDASKVSAENALYTSYWASLLTMAKFLYGNPDSFQDDINNSNAPIN